MQHREPGFGRGHVEELALRHQRAHPINLLAAPERPPDAVQHVRERRERVDRGADRPAPAGFAGQPAHLHLAPLRQQQACAGSASRSSPARRSARPSIRAAAAAPPRTGAARRSPPAPGRDTRTASWNSACVPTISFSRPSAICASASRRSAPFTDPVSSTTGTGDSAESVRWCCLASTSVGAISAACRPASAALSIASSATSVLPEPDIALQQPQHPPRGGEIGVDLRQRLAPAPAWACARTVPAPAPAARHRRRSAGPAGAGRAAAPRPSRPDAPAARHRRAAPAACRPAPRCGACTACSASRNPGQRSRRISAASCHSGELRHLRERPPHRLPKLRREQPGGQRPHRLQPGHLGRLLQRRDPVGIAQLHPAVERLDLAGDGQLRALLAPAPAAGGRKRRSRRSPTGRG